MIPRSRTVSSAIWTSRRRLRPVSYTHLDVYKRQEVLKKQLQKEKLATKDKIAEFIRSSR